MKKDLEWLKEEVDKNVVPTLGDESYYLGIKPMVDVDLLNELIDQLDEPEVLSQELPVIPRFVAEWIENNESVGWWRKIAEWEWEVPEKDRKVYDWYQNYNEDDFIIAWITENYTIVEEQKYQVIIKDGEHVRLYLSKSHDAVSIGTNDNYIEKCPEVTYLTEKEIKDYDERFWAFAVKV